MDCIGLVGVETGHHHTRELLVHECLGFPPIEHRVVLVGIDIHQRGYALAIVGRDESIDITELHSRTYFLVVGDGIFYNRFLLVGHVFGLEFKAETSAHSYVGTEFDRYAAECLMVWRSRDV